MKKEDYTIKSHINKKWDNKKEEWTSEEYFTIECKETFIWRELITSFLRGVGIVLAVLSFLVCLVSENFSFLFGVFAGIAMTIISFITSPGKYEIWREFKTREGAEKYLIGFIEEENEEEKE